MRRKSVFKLFLAGIILLQSIFLTSCGWEYLGYPVIASKCDSEGRVFLIYEGSKYYRTSEILPDSVYGIYFLNFEEREIIGANNVFGGRLPVCISPKDEEKIIIEYSVVGLPWYFAKEGFELPDIFTSKISKVFLQKGWYDTADTPDDAGREYVLIDGATTFFDLVEQPSNNIEGTFHYRCYLELDNFEFLKVGNFGVIENGNLLYLNFETDTAFYEYKSDIYYPIKDEYQQVFRDAIKELNS